MQNVQDEPPIESVEDPAIEMSDRENIEEPVVVIPMHHFNPVVVLDRVFDGAHEVAAETDAHVSDAFDHDIHDGYIDDENITDNIQEAQQVVNMKSRWNQTITSKLMTF